MDTERIREIIIQELPGILKDDPEIREFVLRLSREHFADKAETESRFDRLLDELRQDREEQRQRWEAQEQKWAENQATINQILQQIQKAETKYQSTIGALGARWGLSTEQSFRNGLKGILEDWFKVEVLNVVEYDDAGVVFGRPEQVELDLIIKNGVLIICEIKSSMSKSDMHSFYSKAEFYQKRHERQASRLLVISPMVAPNAYPVAKKLGIEVYSYAGDVSPEVFSLPESET